MRTRYNDYWLYVEAEADDELRRLAAEARERLVELPEKVGGEACLPELSGGNSCDHAGA
jgi:hypothetical protein